MATFSKIPWNQIKAMSFDIYGTLIDWESGIVDTSRATALGPFLPASRRELLANMEKHERSVQKENPTMLQSDIIAEALGRYAKELQVVESGKLTQAQVDEAAATYGKQIGTYPAFEDTVAAIQKLAKRFKLIPLTNVDNASFSQTRSGPLAGCHFDAVYTAQDIGSYKPDQRNFQYLEDHLKQDFGLSKNELCHTAQSLYHDHLAGRKAGLPYSVWVDRKGVMGNLEGKEPTENEFGYKLKVNTLGELAEMVEKEVA